jgi:hypothetical protein
VEPVKIVLLALLVACSDLQNFASDGKPLAQVEFQVTGNASLLPADVDLHVAMVWSRQWLVEPICILPPENADAAALIAAGCRDPFGFVAARVDSNIAAAPGAASTLGLFSAPTADVLVGDVTARVGYASMVVYDDRDHSNNLELARPNRPADPGMGMGSGSADLPTNLDDVVYGASFISMTEPDQRVGFREGEFSAVAAFYPRAGCGDPPVAFSALAAGGFTAQAAIDATLAGTLPTEDPTTCTQTALAATTISIPIQDPANVKEIACSERTTDSSVRYRDPAPDGDKMPDLTNRVVACVHSPSFGAPSDVIEFIVSGTPDDSCVGLTHYVLKGCSESPTCASPDWDHSGAPPSWWPCGT